MLSPGSNDRKGVTFLSGNALRFDPSKSSAIPLRRQVAQQAVIPGSARRPAPAPAGHEPPTGVLQTIALKKLTQPSISKLGIGPEKY